ncbi:Prefoldin subunit-domain-containing protein [Lineolata rhizophorae]|uniref:Prefoldin subunit-domain-containing protein n=1 Tax=Lineolata rhizophorae TaxID=578093 RepID=A0A6A6NPU5_9PEZI|nr:Prefoldin subunit-domain-containing protein [Lineolata rhizophorae]
MANRVRDSMADLERRRLQLEDNVAKLRNALRHWQTLEAEYNGIKDELENLGDDASPEEMMNVGEDFGSDLVSCKELEDIIGRDQARMRSPRQVADVISKRIEYVKKNVQSVQKQLSNAEDKLAGVLVVSNPDLKDEADLPVTEILEELDEDGNVISSSTRAPGAEHAQLVEALRSAGISIPDGQDRQQPEESQPDKSTHRAITQDPHETGPPHYPTPKTKLLVPSKNEQSSSRVEASRTLHEPGITGAVPGSTVGHFEGEGSSNLTPESGDAIMPGTIQLPRTNATDMTHRSADGGATGGSTSSAKSSGEQTNIKEFPVPGTVGKGDRILELNDDDHVVGSVPIMPAGESSEDARLRREMLQYAMNEISPIVAELDLEEAHNDDSDYDDEEADEDLEDADDDDLSEEDDWGRSLRGGISDDYRERMMALEKKLNAHMIENVGPGLVTNARAPNGVENDARRLVVKPDEDIEAINGVRLSGEEPANFNVAERIPKEGKKGVRFADELDILPESKPAKKVETRPPRAKEPRVPAMSNVVVERNEVKQESTTSSRHSSRFKTARNSATARAPQASPNDKNAAYEGLAKNPEIGKADANSCNQFIGRTLLGPVVEKPMSGPLAPPEDSSLDHALHQREIFTAYHTARNRMIQKQGGFDPSPEDIVDPLYEEKNGKIKKVSRFRAARMKFNQFRLDIAADNGR